MAAKKKRVLKKSLLTTYKDAVKRGQFGGLVKIIDGLIDQKADFNLRTGDLFFHLNQGLNFIEWLSDSKLHDELIKIIKTGPRLDEFTPSGHTLLTSNAIGSPVVVKALLEAGANPNQPHRNGKLPLGCCVASAYMAVPVAVECARLLLVHGADPDLPGDASPFFKEPRSSLAMAIEAQKHGPTGDGIMTLVGMLQAKHDENALINEALTAKAPSK
jgi:ankyrin repeat protein